VNVMPLDVRPLDVNGTNFDVDEGGYLKNAEDWSAEMAEAMASIDGIKLLPEHWEVIHFLRGYYEEYKIAPAVRVLTKAIGKSMGREKGNSKYLYELFPFGPAKQACKYAGLPKPTGCV
jgi:TusE/DsrC/DsvC family sulfur relay protein